MEVNKMSEMKYQDFVLSKTGWVVALFLSVCCYLAYYLWVYPDFASVPMRQVLYSKTVGNPILDSIDVYIDSPIYVSNFQNTPLTININNLSTTETIIGTLILTPSKANLILDDKQLDVYKFDFKLLPKQSVVETVDIKLVDRDSINVVFSVDLTNLKFTTEKREEVDLTVALTPTPSSELLNSATPLANETPAALTLTPIVAVEETPMPAPESPTDMEYESPEIPDFAVKWATEGYLWKERFPEDPGSACVNQMDLPQSEGTFCAINHPYGAFAQSTLSILLIPPWSSLSALALVFGIVWLLEQFLPLEWMKSIHNRDLSFTYHGKYFLFLLFSSTLLLYLITKGVLYIFGNINHKHGEIYFFAFVVISFLVSLFVAWATSQLIQKWVQAGIPSNNFQDLIDIDAAYKENNLPRLRYFTKLVGYSDSQRIYAMMRFYQLGVYLQYRVYIWGEGINEGDYEEVLRSINGFIKDTPNIASLPDKRKDLSSLLSNTSQVKFSVEDEWVFEDPKKAGEIIIQALKSKIAETGPETPVEPPTLEEPETNAPVSNDATPIITNNKNDGADSGSTATSSGDNFPQKNVPVKPRKKKGNN